MFQYKIPRAVSERGVQLFQLPVRSLFVLVPVVPFFGGGVILAVIDAMNTVIIS
jgi:hypothetical protein